MLEKFEANGEILRATTDSGFGSGFGKGEIGCV